MYTEEQKQQLAERKKLEKRQEMIDAIMVKLVEIFVCTIIGGSVGYLFGIALTS